MSKPKLNFNRECIFTGRRLARSGKTIFRFELLPNREEMNFGKINGVYIGCVYRCSKGQISKRPEFVRREEEINPQWEALDALVDAHNQKKRTQAKLCCKLCNPQINKVIEALKPLLKEISFIEHDAFVTHIVWKARNAK